MMLVLVPAWMRPTVTTAVACGEICRDTTVCSRITSEAAMTTGSIPRCGADPCAPLPCSVTRKSSQLAMIGPGARSTLPAGPGRTCWASATSGRGSRSTRPSATIASAPLNCSSAGWKTATTVPSQASRSASSSRSAPSRVATCVSWPQACITGTVSPSARVARTVAA